MEPPVKDMLMVLGPNTGLLFAAWIFLSFLQQRYTSSYDRYRALIGDYRGHPENDARHRSLREQVLLYKKRCEKMRLATNVGIVSAMLSFTGLICAALSFFPMLAPLQYASVVLIIAGLTLVVVASVIVLLENIEIQHAIESEISDMPELVDGAAQARGMPLAQY